MQNLNTFLTMFFAWNDCNEQIKSIQGSGEHYNVFILIQINH